MASRSKVSAGQSPDAPVFDSYARLSRNPNTREIEKIDTQHDDNRTTIARHGGRVGERLDDGMSAWKRDARRKGFEDLLERARTGLSQGIAVWHVDRLFRQPRDLERLIDLANSGFLVISSHGSRDLSDPDDRYILRIEVAHAARSSDDTSRRTRRRNVKYREEGRQTGGRPGFGFERRGRSWQPVEGQEEEDRPTIPVERVAEERRVLRAAVEGLLAGLTTQAKVARTWNAAGLSTPEGNQWATDSVRDTLLRPALAGRVEYDGELISYFTDNPIIDEAQWLRLRAKINGRRRGRPASGKYLGSGLLRCGACRKVLNGQVTAQTIGNRPRCRYYCNGQRGGCGKVTIDMTRTDAELRLLTIARLSDSRYAQAISAARSQVSDRLAEVNDEIREIEGLMSALAERLGRREIRIEDHDKSYAPLMADLRPLLEERDRILQAPVDGPDSVLSEVAIARQWDSGSTTERRALLADAIGGDEVRVLPTSHSGKRAFDPGRIRLTSIDTPLVSAS